MLLHVCHTSLAKDWKANFLSAFLELVFNKLFDKLLINNCQTTL